MMISYTMPQRRKRELLVDRIGDLEESIKGLDLLPEDKLRPDEPARQRYNRALSGVIIAGREFEVSLR